jgi:endonuclease YncB( thermonuclease family)
MGRFWATITQAEVRRCLRNGQGIRWLSPLRSLPWSLLYIFLVVARVIAADFSGQVVSVLDGDTLEVLHNQHPEPIRLSDIDCPEKGQAYGQNAKHAASVLAFGKDVMVQTHRRGSGGRGNRVSGQSYFLALARLSSACVGLSGTMMVAGKKNTFP